MTYQTGQHTDKGPRRSNQDAARTDPDLGYAIVADGMGGAAGGDEASRMAVDLAEWLLRRELPVARRGASVPALLRRVFQEANGWIFGKAQSTDALRGMGTTLVLVVLSEGQYYIAHAGDSRGYRVRDGRIAQITKDHSLVQAKLDAGLITAEQAAQATYRNVITRAVGVDPAVDPDVGEGDLATGDTFVLTTDGVHGVLPSSLILDLASGYEPRAVAESLVREALRRHTSDNATAAVIRAAR